MGTTSHHFCRALERVEATQRSKPRARQGWAGPRQPEPGAGPRTAAASPQRKVTSESTGGSLELFFGGCTAVSPPQPVSYHSRSHQKRLPTLRNRSLSLSLSHPCLLSLSLSPLSSVHPSIHPSIHLRRARQGVGVKVHCLELDQAEETQPFLPLGTGWWSWAEGEVGSERAPRDQRGALGARKGSPWEGAGQVHDVDRPAVLGRLPQAEPADLRAVTCLT